MEKDNKLARTSGIGHNKIVKEDPEEKKEKKNFILQDDDDNYLFPKEKKLERNEYRTKNNK